MAVKACPECGKERSSSARTCPHCGHVKSTLGGFVMLLALVLVVLFLLQAIF